MDAALTAELECPIIGVSFMDKDHREMAAATTRLLATIAIDGDITAVNEAFVDLVSLTLAHFDHEELSMVNNAYPEYGQHRTEHARLVEQISSIADRIKAENNCGLSEDLTRFLHDWLIDHIENYDKPYAHYLREVGAAALPPLNMKLAADLIDGDRHVVLREHREVGQLANLERSTHVLVM